MQKRLGYRRHTIKTLRHSNRRSKSNSHNGQKSDDREFELLAASVNLCQEKVQDLAETLVGHLGDQSIDFDLHVFFIIRVDSLEIQVLKAATSSALTTSDDIRCLELSIYSIRTTYFVVAVGKTVA